MREVLDAEGAGGALDEALRSAGHTCPPSDVDELTTLIGIHLSRVLRAWLGDARAREILAQALNAVRGEPPERAAARPRAPISTMPPPSAAGSAEYDALTSGLVHTRETPVWGLAAVSGAPAVWLVASLDGDLREVAQRSAPTNIELLYPSSTAVLRAALSRNEPTLLVFDALSPSVPLDKVVAGLTEAPVRRVLLWRMPAADRRLLVEAVPFATSWIPVSSEVGPLDLVHLFGA